MWHRFEQGRSERTAADIVARNDVRALADLVHHFDDLSPLPPDASGRLRSVLDHDRALPSLKPKPSRPIATHVPSVTKVIARAGRIFTMRWRPQCL
jgi:hypothetical protein